MTRRTRVARACALALALAAACDETDHGGTRAVQSTPTALTDPQLAQLLLTLNAGEVMQADAVLGRLGDVGAQALAQRMATEHSEAVQREERLFASRGMAPQQSSVSKPLGAQLQADAQRLRLIAPGATLDRTYACLQVREHAMALTLLDQIASVAVDAGLRAEVATVRASVQDHLATAQSVVGAIGAGGDVATTCAGY